MVGVLALGMSLALQSPGPAEFSAAFVKLFEEVWPKNRTVNLVCHGHSVPAGYFKTPAVQSFEAYPHLLHQAIKARFPHAVVNVIVTAIGGENSEEGAARFEGDVLALRPDAVTIDYGLNDRRIGLERARKAWISMLEAAKGKGVAVVLLTPTWDLGARPEDAADPLAQHAEQIRRLAAEYHVGLADSLKAFEAAKARGVDVNTLMSQGNHPNRAGHELVVRVLAPWFGAG